MIFKKNKSILPNYGVFDEKRYFTSGIIEDSVFEYKNKKIKFLICEEMWSSEYIKDCKKEVDLLICINASPYEINKYLERESGYQMY